jgi:hypothetical protein
VPIHTVGGQSSLIARGDPIVFKIADGLGAGSSMLMPPRYMSGPGKPSSSPATVQRHGVHLDVIAVHAASTMQETYCHPRNSAIMR